MTDSLFDPGGGVMSEDSTYNGWTNYETWAVEQDEAVRAFNEMVASWTTPEARERRARERAEYEARYEAMMARKRTERFNAQFEYVLSTYFAPYWELDS